MIGKEVTVKGWAKTVRLQGAGAFAFVQLNDGSCFESLQIVVGRETTENFDAIVSAGAWNHHLRFF
jgi:asparaginyl-tRNA synthetase